MHFSPSSSEPVYRRCRECARITLEKLFRLLDREIILRYYNKWRAIANHVLYCLHVARDHFQFSRVEIKSAAAKDRSGRTIAVDTVDLTPISSVFKVLLLDVNKELRRARKSLKIINRVCKVADIAVTLLSFSKDVTTYIPTAHGFCSCAAEMGKIGYLFLNEYRRIQRDSILEKEKGLCLIAHIITEIQRAMERLQ
ncbi:hypothetical protein SCHPADRAFT_892632 [Schizopora paradoxa]|uniref:Uncharacterized protein n=1 Tax=Schizopora paradoxa TaxID=27342 RepID=A0A0H2RKR6_9AGAM|nr:hypothetical protein SCHPADRAFT_892632 [Schizopora paradoxa]